MERIITNAAFAFIAVTFALLVVSLGMAHDQMQRDMDAAIAASR